MKHISFTSAHVGMLAWAVLIAASFFAAAQVGQSVDPILLTALRLLLSAVLFLPMLLWQGAARLTWRATASHGVLGLLLAVYFGTLFEALRYASAANTGTLFTLVPLLTLLCEVLLIPGTHARRRLVPMLVAALGAVLLILKGGGPGQWPSLYPVLVYGAGCLAMALYSPLSQRFKAGALQGRGPVAMTFWNMLFGALFLFALCLQNGGWRSATQLTLGDGLWLLYLALFATLGTFWLLHRAIGVIAPATVISYIYLSTLLLTLFNWLRLQQAPLPLEWLGAVLVGAGMLALVMASRRTVAVSL